MKIQSIEALALEFVEQPVRDRAVHAVMMENWAAFQRLDLDGRVLGRVD